MKLECSSKDYYLRSLFNISLLPLYPHNLIRLGFDNKTTYTQRLTRVYIKKNSPTFFAFAVVKRMIFFLHFVFTGCLAAAAAAAATALGYIFAFVPGVIAAWRASIA